MNATTLLASAALALASHDQPQPDAIDRAYVGRQIARDAIIDYRLQPDPGPDDAEASAELLELAAEFRPGDPILLRYLVAAYRAAGDDQRLIDATKRLYEADPGDEVAQLRLISWNISRRQTVEERLAAYGEWLDGRGAEFLEDAPAVASRLALDAALLYREIGDEQAFIGRLAQATRLDSSNKEAAALAAAVFGQRSTDPVARLELAINLLLSDPVDPNLHLSIAEKLAAYDVFDQSRRFYNSANRLYQLTGANSETRSMVNALVALDWYAAGPAAILNAYETQLRTSRADAARRIEQLVDLGQPTDGERRPEDVRLDLERERFRLFAAVATSDRVAIERSIADMEATTQPVIQRLSDRLQSIDPEDTQTRLAVVSEGLQYGIASIVARLIADYDTQVAAQSIKLLEDAWGDLIGSQIDLLYAAAELRTGSVEDATLQLEPFAEQTALGAYFYGLALELSGRPEEAVTQFQRTADAAPLSAIGALANSQAERLRGGPAPEPVDADAMRRAAELVPDWVDRVTTGPRNFMRLSASLENRALPATGEAVIGIELRNLLPRPLALGGDRPIGTRMAVSPRVDVASHVLRGRVNPEVVDAHRKLRLEPGQASTINVWPDAGMMGLLAEIKAGHRVRSRFTVMQSFVVGDGPFRRGPLALSAETELLTRAPLPETIIDPADMIRYAETAQEPDLLDLLPAYRAALADVDFPAGQLPAADATQLAQVLAGRYPRLSRELRAAILAIMPPARVRPEMADLDRAALAETDPDLARLALMTRVTSPDHPQLVRAAEGEDQGLARFARQLQSRLQGDDPQGYAFLGAPPSHMPPDPDAEPGG